MWSFKQFKINRLTKKIKNMQQVRAHNQIGDEMLKKEIAAYYKLVSIYQTLVGKKKYPFASLMILECYREASTINDPQAEYLLAKNLLEEAKFRADLQDKGVFASDNNERRAQQLFQEAHAYLLAAETLNHIQAKRLRGLCYINGWGVEIDKKAGFELVVASIDQENSWDRVPQIFSAIGLNKPEFFSALTQHRKDR